MRSLLLTLFNTKRGLELLDNEFEDDLKRKGFAIFGLYAITQFLFHFNQNKETNGFVINFFELVLTVFLSILIGSLSSYILFKIGQWLGGKAKYIEIFSLLAYTFIPIIIGLITVGFLKKSGLFVHEYNTINSRNFILYLSWFFSLKILIQGLIKFNTYGIRRAILNVSPFIIFYIGIVAFSMFTHKN